MQASTAGDDQPSTSNRASELSLRKIDAGYAVFYCLGVGLLAPWNAFITATDFYEAQYPGKHADRLFTICYLPTQLVILALLMLGSDQTRMRVRIAAGLGGFCLVMFSIPSLDLISGGQLQLWVPLSAVVITAICDGFAQGSLYAEAAAFPAIYTQALVAGTAASGAVLSVLRCITKAALPRTRSGLRASADVYFAAAATICLACFTAYFFVLPRLSQQLKYRLKQLTPAASNAAGEVQQYSEVSSLTHNDKAPFGEDVQLPTQRMPMSQAAIGYHTAGELADATDQVEDSLLHSHAVHPHSASSSAATELPAHSSQRRQSSTQRIVLSAFRSVWRLCASLVVIYAVTLSIFPGVFAEDVKFQELGDWYPIALITLFNFADLGGKSLPVHPKLIISSHSTILASSCARTVIIPLFLVAARQSFGPVVIGSLTLVLGLSNGYCTAVAMMAAPIGLKGKEAAMAGQLVVFALIFGLCIGAALSFLWLL